MRVAIVGTGISGMLIARLLADEHEIVVFESESRIGGHTHALDVEVAGESFRVDTGFMVFNERTYPSFCRLLNLLGVPSRSSDMSFSVRDDLSGIEWEGSSLNGLFAQRTNLLRPAFLRMLRDVIRFNSHAPVWARDTGGELPLARYLDQHKYSQAFRDWYLVPMCASIWSASPEAIEHFPARFLIRFFENHGLLQLANRPLWRTIVGSSQSYVDALVRPFRDQIRVNSRVEKITRLPEGVFIKPLDGSGHWFDEVVIAAHSDQALAMLTDASPLEQEILGAIPYQRNVALVHTDESLLPRSRRAWASWNYLKSQADNPVTVTYNLNRLQGHAAKKQICVTLNDSGKVRDEEVLKEISFSHPVFSTKSMAAQARWNEISGVRRTHYCGAYWRNGFHEDGVVSALRVGTHFGKTLESCAANYSREASDIAVAAR